MVHDGVIDLGDVRGRNNYSAEKKVVVVVLARFVDVDIREFRQVRGRSCYDGC